MLSEAQTLSVLHNLITSRRDGGLCRSLSVTDLPSVLDPRDLSHSRGREADDY